MSVRQPSKREETLLDGTVGPGKRLFSSLAGRNVAPVPDYQIVKQIGVGAYGEVWLAKSTATGMLRAIKFVFRSTFLDERPFEREFEGIKKFEKISGADASHLALFHVGINEHAGYFYYVMELADSLAESAEVPRSSDTASKDRLDSYVPHTLRAELQGGRIPVNRVVEVALELSASLARLHQQGLVHRDVKPSNIVFVGGRAKLADIGLIADTDQRSIVGTEGYLPPEGPGTPQGDIYALGKVIYEASTGLDRRKFPLLPPELRFWAESPRILELNEIVVRACATQADLRYPNAETMGGDLQKITAGRSLRNLNRARRRWRTTMQISVAAAAVAVVATLGGRLQKQEGPKVEPGRPSTNAFANRRYELGMYFFDKRDNDSAERAESYFKEAISADPNFGRAHAGLAWTYTWRQHDDEGWTLLREGKREAEIALDLDESLPLPHIVLGWFYGIHDWNWVSAEKELETAVKLDPDGAITHHMYGDAFLRLVGRVDEAAEQTLLAHRLDPLSIRITQRLPAVLVAARRFEEALEQAEMAITKEPAETSLPDFMRAEAFCALGRYREAIEAGRAYRLSEGKPRETVNAEISKYLEAFKKESTKGYWKQYLAEAQPSSYWQVRAYARLGETNKALAVLSECVRRHDFWLTFYVMNDWAIDPIRNEPEFRKVLSPMGFKSLK